MPASMLKANPKIQAMESSKAMTTVVFMLRRRKGFVTFAAFFSKKNPSVTFVTPYLVQRM